MANNLSECPECGSEHMSRKGDKLALGFHEWTQPDTCGSVEDYDEGEWDCFIGEVQCECLHCGHEWTADTKTTVTSGCVYVARITHPDVSSRNSLAVCKTETTAVQVIADYCREDWRGDEPLPEDDQSAINEFFESRGYAEDYDILQLPIEE